MSSNKKRKERMDHIAPIQRKKKRKEMTKMTEKRKERTDHVTPVKRKKRRKETTKTTESKCVPFWNDTTAALSQFCPWPASTTELDSPTHSWFTHTESLPAIAEDNMMSQKICDILSPILTSPTTTKKQYKTEMIRVFPTPEQKITLKLYFEAYKWTYNRALVELLKQGCPVWRKTLRAHCIKEDILKNSPELKWLVEVPFDVHDAAMAELLNAYKSGMAPAEKKGLTMKNEWKTFSIHQLHPKEKAMSIKMEKKHWYGPGIFYTDSFGKKPLKGAKELPKNLEHDSHMKIMDRGHFFLCLLHLVDGKPKCKKASPHTDTNTNKKKLLSVDPGCCTPFKGYSLDGTTCSYGVARDVERLIFLYEKGVDDVMKRLKIQCLHPWQSWYHMKKSTLHTHQKICDLRHDFHRKVAKELCENYNVILLLEFRVSNMVK